MLKRLLIGLALMALLAGAVAPAVVGVVAERQLEALARARAAQMPLVSIRQTAYRRGWFRSSVSHRVAFDPARLYGALVKAVPAGAELAVDSRLVHGPFPGLTHGNFAPGLGVVESRLTWRGPGGDFPLPGVIVTALDLTGRGTSEYRLDSGTHTDEGGTTATWGEGGAHAQFDPWAGRMEGSGNLKRLRIVAENASSTVTVEGALVRYTADGERVHIDAHGAMALDDTAPGEVDIVLDVGLPAGSSGSALAGLLRTQARGRLRVSPSLAAAYHGDYLRKEGGNYVMDVSYGRGLLKINGEPVAIKLPRL